MDCGTTAKRRLEAPVTSIKRKMKTDG